MDTKWTKFKESSFVKTICVIIACALIACACSSGLKVARYLYCFGAFDNNQSFIDSRSFEYLYYDDINAIADAVTYNRFKADTEAERERGAEQFLAEYKEYKEKYDRYIEQEQNSAISYEEYDNSNAPVTTVTYEYCDNYFSADITVTTIDYTDTIISKSINCDDNLSDDEIKEKFKESFDISMPDYCSPEELEKRGIKNILYYAEADDGTVISNVSSKEELTENTKGKAYLFYENGEITDNCNDIIRNNFVQKNNTNIYIVIDTEFSQNDHYKVRYDNVMAASQLNIEKSIAETAIYSLLALMFFIITLCLAGHKDSQKKTAWIDKVPYDIHLAVTAGITALLVIGFSTYILEFYDTLYFYHDNSYNTFPSFLYAKPWYPVLAYTFAVFSYLAVTEFFTSLARGIKTKTNVFKNTFIYMLCAFIVKVIVKFFKTLKAFIKGIVYKPKHFSRKTTAIIVLYTLFNLCAFGFIIMLFAMGDGIAAMFAVLFSIGLLALDGYIIYLMMKYLKSLDTIITAVENGEPISENADSYPNSLKVLANSYDIANANLQSAIVKAVKDERTKAELITNVSHDLKTPLTSVINYIDLLQKCNIEDETAKSYMSVIAEKSGKLKRLIEDLIEASKISSGNVAINKTKLNLNELSAQAIVEETAEFEKRNLQLIFEEPSKKHIAFADGTKIYRVLENLLSNAKKYSASGSRVYARLYSGNDCEYFEIKNISKEQLNISAQELTERFVRGDKSRNEDGNGLGLSIATELCRLNGGELIISIDGDLFKATVKIPKE